MGKMLKTSADNRKCMFPNCENILSIYNHEPYCHIHRDHLPLERNSKTQTRILTQIVRSEVEMQRKSEHTL